MINLNYSSTTNHLSQYQNMKNESIFSESFKSGKRTYFFDIKETSANKRYLSITESKKLNDKFERFKLLVFEEDIAEFSKYFNSSLLNLI